jgi:hypothetical protein
MMDGKSIELETNHPWPIFFKLLRCSATVFKYVNVDSTSYHSAFSYIGMFFLYYGCEFVPIYIATYNIICRYIYKYRGGQK